MGTPGEGERRRGREGSLRLSDRSRSLPDQATVLQFGMVGKEALDMRFLMSTKSVVQ